MDHVREIIKTPLQGLIPGKRYRVTKSFLDARKAVHPKGETWIFVGHFPNEFTRVTYIFTAAPNTDFGITWDDTTTLADFIQEIPGCEF